MYLTRMQLNAGSGTARREALDCQALHRRLMSAIPRQHREPRAAAAMLFRMDRDRRTGAMWLYVQSQDALDWTQLPPHYLVEGSLDQKGLDGAYAAIRPGMVLAFRLRANPTRKIDTRSSPSGERRNGRRVPLRDEDAALQWLARKGEQAGFAIVQATASVEDLRHGTRQEGSGNKASRRLTFASTLFQGYLRVTDADVFRGTLTAGIGTAKAYGFGLLSVAPAPRAMAQ